MSIESIVVSAAPFDHFDAHLDQQIHGEHHPSSLDVEHHPYEDGALSDLIHHDGGIEHHLEHAQPIGHPEPIAFDHHNPELEHHQNGLDHSNLIHVEPHSEPYLHQTEPLHIAPQPEPIEHHSEPIHIEPKGEPILSHHPHAEPIIHHSEPQHLNGEHLVDYHGSHYPSTHGFSTDQFVHGYDNLLHAEPAPLVHHQHHDLGHVPAPIPVAHHEHLEHVPVVHSAYSPVTPIGHHNLAQPEHFSDLHLSFYNHRMPGDGFGPGGHFSLMPRQEVISLPVKIPVQTAKPVPVDSPYPVLVDKPFPVHLERIIPKPFISKVIQPLIHKQTIIKSHITHIEHDPSQHGAANYGALDYPIKKRK